MRILLLIAIALLLYLVFRQLWRRTSISAARPKVSQNMVRCEYCGLHLLPREATQKNGLNFCTPEHVEAYFNKQ